MSRGAPGPGEAPGPPRRLPREASWGAHLGEKWLGNSFWALLEITQVFFSAPEGAKSASEAILGLSERASARSWLPCRFGSRFWLQKVAILASKMVLFGDFMMLSLSLFRALIFGRFSLRRFLEIRSFRALRQKGAYGFRLVKTNGFLRFFHVCEAAGRASRQATE